jgi:hypothetical protein
MFAQFLSKFSSINHKIVISLIIALVLYLCTLGGLYMPGIWPLEGGISFLPQVFVIVLLWLAVFALLVRRSWAMIDRNGRSLVAIHVVLLGMFILNSLVPLLEFAYINQPAPAAASSSKIRVAFFNKLYTNYDYEAISQEIIDLKPDVIGFALSLIRFDQKYANIFSFVFGSTLVVEDLKVPGRIGRKCGEGG